MCSPHSAGSEQAIPVALTAGFERGSIVAAGMAIAAALAAGLLLRPAERATEDIHSTTHATPTPNTNKEQSDEHHGQGGSDHRRESRYRTSVGDEALRLGAKHVYAASRQPLTHSDARVTSLTFDLTDAAQIDAAASEVDSLDLLVNNAGISLVDDLEDREALDQHLAVNLFGTYAVTQAFLPVLTRSRGAVVNVVSLAAFAPVPSCPRTRSPRQRCSR